MKRKSKFRNPFAAKLWSDNLGGNLHMARMALNDMGMSQYVLQLTNVGQNTIVIYRVPWWKFLILKRQLRLHNEQVERNIANSPFGHMLNKTQPERNDR